jgi:hypothetical protein
VGVQTNDTDLEEKGSIQLRASTIGTVAPTSGQLYTASDIEQVTPTSFTNSPYLSAPGIQIGPGVDLVTKTAGGKPFSVFSYPTTLYYGLRGNLQEGQNSTHDTYGFLWPGTTNVVQGGTYPNPDTNESNGAAFYRLQQSALLVGMQLSCNSASGYSDTTHALSTTVQVYRTPFQGGSLSTRESLSSFSMIIGPTETFFTNYSFSQLFNQGDLLGVHIHGFGGRSNLVHDLTLQLDLF